LLDRRRLGRDPALRRQLGLEGASLSALVDHECFERAQHALTETDQTIAELAAALGYSELGSFYRAFRRWSGGGTPGALRASVRGSV
jgi:AraC-like DNA-binding protein